MTELDALTDDLRSDETTALRLSTRTRLYDEVAGMSMANFLVRPKRKQVEQFQNKDAWEKLDDEARQTLINDIAGLPTSYADDDLAARQFDYFVLSGQLMLLRHEAAFSTFKQKMVAVASRLEALGNIPMVAAKMALILELQTDEYWQDIDAPMLEQARKRLRLLVKLVEGEERIIVYTDFEDEIGDGITIKLPDSSDGTDKNRFQMKVRHFLKEHADHIAIQKLRLNEQLTQQDLSELERIMLEEAVASREDLQRVRADGGLGLFIRSLVGLEREAAKKAMAAFIDGRTLSANQIEFVSLIVDYLTERGAMDPRRLYESPFIDFDDQGVSGVFSAADVTALMNVLESVRQKAAA